MSDELQRYLEVASDVTRTTLGVTERAVAQFVRQGEVAAEHAERLVDELIARSVESSGAVAHLVRAEVERAIERAGFVRSEELEALRDEVGVLRRQAAEHNGSTPPVRSSDVGERP
ncbi:MAG: hypothetical protein KY460_08010 [Actinobacteria bacterium]|nr:hypothetical protein [Actinomycetota bacterium]